MTPSHEARIARAETLAGNHPASAPLLKFYIELARFQQPIFCDFQTKGGTDPRGMVYYFRPLIELIGRTGTDLLVDFAARNLTTPKAQIDLLLTAWEGGEALDPAGRFYARVLLQPF